MPGSSGSKLSDGPRGLLIAESAGSGSRVVRPADTSRRTTARRSRPCRTARTRWARTPRPATCRRSHPLACLSAETGPARCSPACGRGGTQLVAPGVPVADPARRVRRTRYCASVGSSFFAHFEIFDRIVPRDVNDGVILAPRDRAARTLRMPPARAGDVSPPRHRIVEGCHARGGDEDGRARDQRFARRGGEVLRVRRPLGHRDVSGRSSRTPRTARS